MKLQQINMLLLALTLSSMTALPASAEELKVEMIGATASDKDSSDVLAALQKLLTSLEEHNYEKIASCLSDNVVTIDEVSQEMLHGKEAVLDKVRRKVSGSKGNSPVKSISVSYPFVSVKGDTAMVSFKASKELADGKGSKLESLCSEVYERKNGEWLILNLRTHWLPAK